MVQSAMSQVAGAFNRPRAGGMTRVVTRWIITPWCPEPPRSRQEGKTMGETRATTTVGRPTSVWRLRRRHSKTVFFLMSVVAVALGATNLTGQASASVAGRLATTPVAKAACSPAGTGNEAIVDLDSHRSFARLRTVCVGTLHGTGVIDAGALFVLQDVGTNTEIVRVDLTTYAVKRSTPLVNPWIFAGLGDIFAETSSNVTRLVELSPPSLRVLHRFAVPDSAWDFVPFAGRLWFIDNYSLKTLNPISGRISLVRLPWLPAGLSPESVTSSGGQLYLLGASKNTPVTAIATYNPVSGAHRVVSETGLGGGAHLIGATDSVLWVEPPGGNQSHVTAYSAETLRPLAGGFGDGGWNGSWVAVPEVGDLWFQLAGGPLECVLGRTGRLDATLRLPNTFIQDNVADATPPGFVAADATNLIVAANETHGANPSESGIAVYALDPRCRA
jgi:hypothetical protein